MLKDQVLHSGYFKHLLRIETIEDLMEEIDNCFATCTDTLDVYNEGSAVSPSCFICQVYRLFTLPQAEDINELQLLLEHPRSAAVRCAGFLFLRFVIDPSNLWEKLEEHLFDDMELLYVHGGKPVRSTVGEYVENLLAKDKYFSTPVPRIPVKVRQMLERELAPLPQYRKRMRANLRTFENLRIAGLPVEVCIDSSWVSGVAKEFVGRPPRRRRLRVRLEDGLDVVVHLGKVVLNEEAAIDSAGESESGARRKGRKRSPDWSRYKGRDDADMVREMRERAKEDAVCSNGRECIMQRPLTVEEFCWKKTEGGHGVSLLGTAREDLRRSRAMPQDSGEALGAGGRRKRPADDEDLLAAEERQKRMRSIYEKYGSTASARPPGGTVQQRIEVEKPDVLRLG